MEASLHPDRQTYKPMCILEWQKKDANQKRKNVKENKSYIIVKSSDFYIKTISVIEKFVISKSIQKRVSKNIKKNVFANVIYPILRPEHRSVYHFKLFKDLFHICH